MRTTRALLGGLGTSVSLIVAGTLVLFVLSATLAFRGWPSADPNFPVDGLTQLPRGATSSSRAAVAGAPVELGAAARSSTERRASSPLRHRTTASLGGSGSVTDRTVTGDTPAASTDADAAPADAAPVRGDQGAAARADPGGAPASDGVRRPGGGAVSPSAPAVPVSPAVPPVTGGDAPSSPPVLPVSPSAAGDALRGVTGAAGHVADQAGTALGGVVDRLPLGGP